MNNRLFITGTGTGVGKTYASAYVCHLLHHIGARVCYYKPIQCGPAEASTENYIKGDAELVEKLLNNDEIRTHNTFYLSEPASPHLAFQDEGKGFCIDDVDNDISLLGYESDFVVCEGAGGILVPISLVLKWDMRRLMGHLKTPVLIVADPELGTINHTLLTIESLKQQNIPILGFVFSTPKADFQETHITTNNAMTIEVLSSIPFLGYIPFIQQGRTPAITESALLTALQEIYLPE